MEEVDFDYLDEVDNAKLTKFNKLSGVTCDDLYPLIDKLVKGKSSELDDLSITILKLLSDICKIHFDQSDKSNPYKPAFRWTDGSTTFSPEYIPFEKLDGLEKLGHLVTLNDLKARIFDMVWVRDKSRHLTGKKAVKHFLNAIEEIHNSETIKFPGLLMSDRIERVLSLAWQLSRDINREPFYSTAKYVIDLVKNIGDQFNSDPSSKVVNWIIHIIGVCIPHRTVDSELYAELLRSIKDKMIMKDDFDVEKWNLRERALHLLIEIENKFGDIDQALEEKKRLAEHYETRAMAMENVKQFAIAASWFSKAFEVARELKDFKDPAQKYHQKMLENQKSASNDGVLIKSEGINLTNDIQQIYETMQGKNREEMFKALITSFSLIRQEDALKHHEWMIETSVSRRIFPRSLTNESGQTIATASSDEEFREYHLGEHSRLFLPLQVQLSLASLNVIIGTYTITERDLIPLLQNNYFVKPKQILNYLTALKYGFELKFYEATYLLLPLLENSIRWILYLNGEITTKYEDKIQEEYLLNSLLKQDHIDLTKYFEDDMIHTFKMLFIHKFGYNLRNRAMHGLEADSNLGKYEYIYTWFLALFLVFWGKQAFNLGKPSLRFTDENEENDKG